MMLEITLTESKRLRGRHAAALNIPPISSDGHRHKLTSTEEGLRKNDYFIKMNSTVTRKHPAQRILVRVNPTEAARDTYESATNTEPAFAARRLFPPIRLHACNDIPFNHICISYDVVFILKGALKMTYPLQRAAC